MVIKRKRVLAFASVFVIAVVLVALTRRGASSTVHQGRSLDAWFRQAVMATRIEERQSAHEAIQSVPPDTLHQFLSDKLRTRDDGWADRQKQLWSLLPTWVQDQLPQPLTAAQIKKHALYLVLKTPDEFDDGALLSQAIAHLQHRDDNIRRMAAFAIPVLAPDSASGVPELASLLSDPFGHVRQAAIEALGDKTQHAKDVMDPILAFLNDGDRQIQVAALQALRKIVPGDHQVIKAIIDCEQDSMGYVRDFASFTLEQMATTERAGVVEVLNGEIQEERLPYLPRTAVTRWKITSDKNDARSALEAISTAIQQPEQQKAFDCLALLAKHSDLREQIMAHVPTELVKEGLEHRDSHIRSAAAELLPHLPSTEEDDGTLTTLIDNLYDRTAKVRESAAQALGERFDEADRITPHLIQQLAVETNSRAVRKMTLALGNLGPSAADAVPILIEKLSEDSEQPYIFAKALGRIGASPEQSLAALASTLTRGDENLLYFAIDSIGDFGTDAEWLVPNLLRTMEQSNRALLATVLRALHRIGTNNPEALNLLETTAEDGNETLNHLAVFYLWVRSPSNAKWSHRIQELLSSAEQGETIKGWITGEPERLDELKPHLRAMQAKLSDVGLGHLETILAID